MSSVPAYTRLAEHYDDLVGYSQFDSARLAFERAVMRHGLRFSTVADFGCGTGLFVRYLCARGVKEVYAVDRSPQMLRIAVSRGCGCPANFLPRDFVGLCLPRPVDLITTFSFTLNLRRNARELRELIRSAWRNLSPGGCWMFDFLTPLRDGARFLRLKFRLAGGVERHDGWLYPPRYVARELTRAGFILLDAFDYLTHREPNADSCALVFIARKPGD